MASGRFGRALLRGEPITVYGDGSQSRDFTFVADAVEANWRAWREPSAGGVYNVGGGSQVELGQAIAILGRALGDELGVGLVARSPGVSHGACPDTAPVQADLDLPARVVI